MVLSQTSAKWKSWKPCKSATHHYTTLKPSFSWTFFLKSLKLFPRSGIQQSGWSHSRFPWESAASKGLVSYSTTDSMHILWTSECRTFLPFLMILWPFCFVIPVATFVIIAFPVRYQSVTKSKKKKDKVTVGPELRGVPNPSKTFILNFCQCVLSFLQFKG